MSNRNYALAQNALLTLMASASLLLFALFMTGCGGGSNQPASTRSGKVQVQVQWPAYQAVRSIDKDIQLTKTGRYIPAYAQSLFLELYLTSDPTRRYRIAANRPDEKPSVQAISFNQFLPVGDYTLAAVARAEKDGLGATVASASAPVVVTEGQTFNAELTLASTLKTLSIQGQPLSVSAGSLLTLTGQALDPDGKTILLPVGALTWKLVSGSEFANLTSDGAFTANSAGTAHVKLSEDGAGVSTEADVTITASNSTVSGLAKSSWPKYGGDVANTGRGGGSGAVGTIVWGYGANGTPPVQNRSGIKGATLGPDGSVFVSSVLTGIPGEGPRISALDNATGAEKWIYKSADVYAQLGLPTLSADNSLYVGDASGYVVALDSATGGLKWKFKTHVGASLVSPASNISSDGTVFVNSDFAYALDGKTGTQKWSFESAPLGAGFDPNPPAIGPQNAVYFGDRDPLIAIDGVTGSILWRVSSPNSIAGSFGCPAVGSDGTVYCQHSGIPSVLYAFDGRTGAKKWQFILSQTADVQNGSPSIGADGTVYAVGDFLYAISPVAGTMIWKGDVGFINQGITRTNGTKPSIAADGTIYTFSGRVYGFDKNTGTSKLLFNTRVSVYANSVSIGPDGNLYIGDLDTLYKIR